MEEARFRDYTTLARTDCQRLLKGINRHEAWLTTIAQEKAQGITFVDNEGNEVNEDPEQELVMDGSNGEYYKVDRDEDGYICDFSGIWYYGINFEEDEE